MNTTVWVIQGLLSAFFLMPASIKLLSSREKLVKKKMLEPNQSPAMTRFIGTMELLGSIGIILPELSGKLTVLTPIASVGFALIMVGASIVHLKRKEYKILPLLTIIFALSVFVAIYRF